MIIINEKITHQPVMVQEVLSCLSIKKNKTYTLLDCTFGCGGHSKSILEFSNNTKVIALDCDPASLYYANKIEYQFGKDRFKFYNINYKFMSSINYNNFDGILFDLGVSSLQLDTPNRGFSFKNKGPLDMRMDNRISNSAYDFLKKSNKNKLIEAIRDYGEEKEWKKIVNKILEIRNKNFYLFNDTVKFAELIKETKKNCYKKKIHPATQTFQGIRIAVNNELNSLKEALLISIQKLLIGGKIIVISFHSLEDRIVKKFFKILTNTSIDNINTPKGKILFKKPLLPSNEEISFNIRSRSAKLRCLEII